MIDTRDSKKVYYPITPELEAKSKTGLGINTRKRYITKLNNPFGNVEGIVYTGDGIMAAFSKSRSNFLRLNAQTGLEFDSEKWDYFYPKIRTVINAIAADTIESAKGKTKKGDMFNTRFEVEDSTRGYDEFFWDSDKKQIYRYEIIE
ncbi:MAG: hypothetical protein CML44_05855 [Rhodobacteraceae bacterium]|nr:hypothetical protein [Paracoccaceae bacterium]|tara:strand:+ start:114 stop:554 length:441 start_codon:yes stop_codon:yes gene_type:complete